VAQAVEQGIGPPFYEQELELWELGGGVESDRWGDRHDNFLSVSESTGEV